MGAFEGVAEIYEQARRSYPIELREHLIDIGALRPGSLVVDLGAGTGQLTRLVAPVADEVVAVEPEADMCAVGRRVTAGLSNVRWVQCSDVDLRQHVAPGRIDVVTIGNAFHHMDHDQLLQDLDHLVSPDGGLCIATSSVPVWSQDREWSAALRSELEREFGPLDGSGVPDIDATAAALVGSAFSDMSTRVHEQVGVRSAESVLGEVISSASGRLSPATVDRLRVTLGSFAEDGDLAETVRATAVIAYRSGRSSSVTGA